MRSYEKLEQHLNSPRTETKGGLELARAPAYFLLDHEIFTIVRASTPHSQDRDMIKYRLRETNTAHPVTSTAPCSVCKILSIGGGKY